MKRLVLTVVLTLGLSVSVLAGESPTCGILDIPPTPVVGTTPHSEDGATDTTHRAGSLRIASQAVARPVYPQRADL